MNNFPTIESVSNQMQSKGALMKVHKKKIINYEKIRFIPE